MTPIGMSLATGSHAPRMPRAATWAVHQGVPVTITDSTSGATAAVTAKGGTWIDDWRPEDEAFWENGGKKIARRNLIWSIFAEHLGFSVWLLWSVSAAMLLASGFSYTPQQLFFLVA